MQSPPPRPRARFTSSALDALRAEVGGSRDLFVRCLNAILYHLPREAGGLLGTTVKGRPNCFAWKHALLHDGVRVEIVCVVSRTGWPDNLWVMDVFVT